MKILNTDMAAGQARGFVDAYKGRKVLITGHTGFKGSWLALWLAELGADVVGLSLYLPSDPCNFKACNLRQRLTHLEGDVRDEKCLFDTFSKFKPDIIFHLAAQPIVRRSFDEPKLTFETNLIGTVNVLECVRKTPSVRAGVVITSDKCYENVEWVWGYRENDRLGGKDPYSASKACAEIATHAYMRSYFSANDTPRLTTARAGNVIGGGDWAADRIVPDCVRAISAGRVLEIRNPGATRPWQHVLEPLSGYLLAGSRLLGGCEETRGSAFNFGPPHETSWSVGELTSEIARRWGAQGWRSTTAEATDGKECTNLKLNCDKALNVLGWRAVLLFEETVRLTVDWYKTFYGKGRDMRAVSMSQIGEYTNLARERGLTWAQ